MYNNASDYYKSLFNEKVYKISLNLNLSCPNRNKDKTGGCIFCSPLGSGEFASSYNYDIKKQIDEAINLVKSKGAHKFIAYFQNYTNTYAPLDYLKYAFIEAINDDRIVALSIATRPDSISEECYKLLGELNKRKKVFVELGLQTSNDDTASFINRGYKSIVYKECSSKLRSLNINIITHIIIGLPHETKDDLLNTISFINPLTDGVKFTILYVLKYTKLYNLYKDGIYTPLEKNEYINLLSTAIEYLNPKIVVHRITGDGPKSLLVAPLYTLNKKDMLNSINKYFKDYNIIQGKMYKE